MEGRGIADPEDLLPPEGPHDGDLEADDIVDELDEAVEGGDVAEVGAEVGAEVEPDFDEMLEVEAETEADEPSADDGGAGDASDDTVRLYLKDIGREDLLSTDQELWFRPARGPFGWSCAGRARAAGRR
jgi:hypothetical protein